MSFPPPPPAVLPPPPPPPAALPKKDRDGAYVRRQEKFRAEQKYEQELAAAKQKFDTELAAEKQRFEDSLAEAKKSQEQELTNIRLQAALDKQTAEVNFDKRLTDATSEHARRLHSVIQEKNALQETLEKFRRANDQWVENSILEKAKLKEVEDEKKEALRQARVAKQFLEDPTMTSMSAT